MQQTSFRDIFFSLRGSVFEQSLQLAPKNRAQSVPFRHRANWLGSG